MDLDINGQKAYAYTGGKAFDATLPTVVFIHGAQNDHSVWGLQSRWFAHHGFGVLAVDLPGHGRSEGDRCPRSRTSPTGSNCCWSAAAPAPPERASPWSATAWAR
jgi:pimeloyl-ACP methyl ester carboxylesterase